MPRTDPVVQTLLKMLDYGIAVASWHGPNLLGAVRGVRAPDAARRVPGRKSIWEQVLHAAYWKQRVLNKVSGTTPFPRRGSNWPRLPDDPSQAAWRTDIQLLRDLHQKLRDAVASLPAGRLDEKLTRMVIGAAFHDIYHAGQIRLLRKMLKAQAG